MKTLYNVFVNGLPKAQPRPRMTARDHVYNPGSANAWKDAVCAEFLSCRRGSPTAHPVRLGVKFFLPYPARAKGKERDAPHAKKPDLDNLLKAVMDAMSMAGVWEDDSRVYETAASKWQTGAQITVETIF